MKLKIDSSIYLKQIHNAFKRSPLVYSNPQDIVSRLGELQEKVNQLMQQNKFYQAACMCNGIIHKCIEHLQNIDDRDGYIGHYLFEVFEVYDYNLKQIDLDKDHFYKETIEFYLTEDFGFANEIIKLILGNVVTEEDHHIIEQILLKKPSDKYSTYTKNKYVDLVVNYYQMIGNTQKFLDTCKKFSPEYWERYIYPAEKYESIGKFDKAVELYEDGIRNSIMYKDYIKAKYSEFKQRMLGVA